ncbi:hypothetical protein MNB_SV-8-1141 [hydrothermal vent metagenome]|uniref:Uncharacterized protein n=1 Tax=hydrothermal vent metagenome TaxID=652676 RepID=A0A1W1C555_9ZZZZ
MPNKFKTEHFEPVNIKSAKDVLQKHLEALEIQKEGSSMAKKEPRKYSLLQRFLHFIKLG